MEKIIDILIYITVRKFRKMLVKNVEKVYNYINNIFEMEVF